MTGKNVPQWHPRAIQSKMDVRPVPELRDAGMDFWSDTFKCSSNKWFSRIEFWILCLKQRPVSLSFTTISISFNTGNNLWFRISSLSNLNIRIFGKRAFLIFPLLTFYLFWTNLHKVKLMTIYVTWLYKNSWLKLKLNLKLKQKDRLIENQ